MVRRINLSALFLAAWLCGLLMVDALLAQQVSFIRRDLPIGEADQRSMSVAVGDFNGDGVLDLAVTRIGASNGSLLLGAGDGTFGPPRDFFAGGRPQSVAVGDFDGDAISDIAVVDDFNGGGVRILLGASDEPFGRTWGLHLGSEPQSVAVGDFNRDGYPDLAVAGHGVYVLLGMGDGTFDRARRVGNGHVVAVEDFNADEYPDLAVGGGDAVSILLGMGDGSFGPPKHFAVGRGVGADVLAVGDFNGDGLVDLAVGGPVYGSLAGNVSILLGAGDGTFDRLQQIPVGRYPNSIVAEDFNGDGRPDLVVAMGDWGAPAVLILLGAGDGTFGPPQMVAAVGGSPSSSSLAVGDFDGDGRADVAVANAGSETVSILINQTPQP